MDFDIESWQASPRQSVGGSIFGRARAWDPELPLRHHGTRDRAHRPKTLPPTNFNPSSTPSTTPATASNSQPASQPGPTDA